MSWLTNVVLPRIRAVVRPREVPDNLWTKCGSCGQMLFQRDLEKNLQICHFCGFHMPVGAERRFEIMFDNGAYTKIDLPRPSLPDPLKFRDSKRYQDRLKEAQGERGPGSDAIQVAHGTIGGHNTVIAAFEFRFIGGSMGRAVGDGIIAAAKLAVLQQAALVVVPASGGARMQEGILSLMQMPRTVIAISEVKEAGLPYIVVATNPTTGGVTASFAMLGDIIIAEPDAIVGFAGQRVIEETIREKLPAGFQRSEYMLEHGMVDMVVRRHELHATLARILGMLRQPKHAEPQTADAA
jgi:acetyl-CoA carboxylase carboxyl transferase subunit beta